MKKLLIFIITLGFVVTLSACTTAELNNLKDMIKNDVLSSKESLATLSYLSGSFVDVDNNESVASSPRPLANTEETEIETELDQVNVYMDRLKEFMENGTDTFGSAVEEVSDNPLYAFKISFTVNEETYFIYYNVDVSTLEISGILVIGDVEYVIEVSNSLLDKSELENDEEDVDTEDEDEDLEDLDLDSEESEQKMVLTAYNGNNFVQVTYKVETDDEETETKFELKSNIDGVERKVFMKISVEEDEFKIKIEEDGNEFTFKSEVEDDEAVYKLKYKVNDVEGEVKIIEKVNDLGETVYEYNIKEGNKSSKVEKVEPDYHNDNDDDDEEEENNEV